MIETIYALIGTVLGFFLSEWSQFCRDRRKARSLVKSVRIIISVEIEKNIRSIDDFWQQVNAMVEDTHNPNRDAIEHARLYLGLPFPRLEYKGFQSQLGNLPDALSRKEIVECFRFYERIENARALKESLLLAYNEQREAWNLATQGKGMIRATEAMCISRTFQKEAPQLWVRAKELFKTILANGNPLFEVGVPRE